MAIGMTYVIIAGGFDLSLAAGFSFCAVVAAVVAQDRSAAIAFIAGMAAGGIVGLANAILIADSGSIRSSLRSAPALS